MADTTKIEWSDATWSPITGCSIMSPGCTHCYAMKLAGSRLKNHPSRKGLTMPTKAGPVWTGEVRFNEQWLDQPLRWTRPRLIFVCAHSDLFHPKVPDAWIDRVFAVMALAPQHTFQVLTKRPDRMRKYLRHRWEEMATFDGVWEEVAYWRVSKTAKAISPEGYERGYIGGCHWWPLPNVWLGTSAERQQEADERIPHLLDTPASVRFLSVEPMLGPIDLASFLWHDPVHGEEQAKRRVRLPGRSLGRLGDHAGRDDMATAQAGLGPLAEDGREPTVQAGEGGAQCGKVPTGWVDAGQRARLRLGASAGLSALQGADTEWPDGKSRGRAKETQSPGQSGIGDLFGAADSRHADFEGWACCEPERGEELHGEVNAAAGSGDSPTAAGRRVPTLNSRALRDQIPARVENSSRRALGALGWCIVGGESAGPRARPWNDDWARAIRDECKAAGVAFFMKQVRNKGAIPDDLMVRQFPVARTP